MSIKKKSILIIDDDPDFRALVKTILEAKAMDVIECPSIERARQYLEEDIPNAILLDMELKNEHGTDFLKEREKNPVWQNIPVIVCSSQNLAVTVKAAIRFGADDYLLKPIKQTWLIQRVRKCLIKENHLAHYFEGKEEIDVIIDAIPSSVTANSFLSSGSIGFEKDAVVIVSIPQPQGEPVIAHFKSDKKSRFHPRAPFETLFSAVALSEESKSRVKLLKSFWKFE
jgi:DNA-binding response OmpR family regulator